MIHATAVSLLPLVNTAPGGGQPSCSGARRLTYPGEVFLEHASPTRKRSAEEYAVKVGTQKKAYFQEAGSGTLPAIGSSQFLSGEGCAPRGFRFTEPPRPSFFSCCTCPECSNNECASHTYRRQQGILPGSIVAASRSAPGVSNSRTVAA